MEMFRLLGQEIAKLSKNKNVSLGKLLSHQAVSSTSRIGYTRPIVVWHESSYIITFLPQIAFILWLKLIQTTQVDVERPKPFQNPLNNVMDL